MPCAFAADSVKDLGQVIRQYLLDHPEVVVESLKHYYANQEAVLREASKPIVSKHEAELFQDAESPESGAPKDPTTIIEFFDYHCGYCRRAVPVVLKLLEERPNVRVIFKELPILGPESMLAARAALASAQQGVYYAFHQALMRETGPLSVEVILRIAKDLGVDATKLRTDMESPKVLASIQRNQELAKALKIESTPSFVIGGALVKGLRDGAELRELIDKAQPEQQPRTAGN
jgi:protein-disulfide isomerase